MKRLRSWGWTAACLCWLAPVALGQDDAARAAAIAEREAAEERYRRLNTAVEGLLNSQVEQQRRLDGLAEELRKGRAEGAAGGGTYVTRAEFTQLLETIREIDRKREADKQMILEELKNLGKSVAASVRSTPRRPDAAAAPKPEAGPAYQEYAEHEVRRGETLSAIVAAYNEEYKRQGKRTSLKLVLEANPNLKPEALAVGQKVTIPLLSN